MGSSKVNIDLRCPRSWRELSEEQVGYVAKLLSDGVESKEELYLRCFLKFTGLRPVIFNKTRRKLYEKFGVALPALYKYKGHKFILENERLFGFCDRLKFLSESPSRMKAPGELAGLAGPNSELWTTTFEEYLMADKYYRAYSESKNENHLCGMVAVLWRKKGKPYRDEDVEKNTKKIRKGTKEAERQAVYLWWTGVKLWIKEKYPDLFSGDTSDENADESETVMNMLYAITEGRAHENERVYKTPVHEVLHALNARVVSSKLIKN